MSRHAAMYFASSLFCALVSVWCSINGGTFGAIAFAALASVDLYCGISDAKGGCK